jgi:hypothetical protein
MPLRSRWIGRFVPVGVVATVTPSKITGDAFLFSVSSAAPWLVVA